MIGPERETLGEYNCNDILTFQFKHVFWVLKRTGSTRRFFFVPTTMFGLDEAKTFIHFCIDVNE